MHQVHPSSFFEPGPPQRPCWPVQQKEVPTLIPGWTALLPKPRPSPLAWALGSLTGLGSQARAARCRPSAAKAWEPATAVPSLPSVREGCSQPATVGLLGCGDVWASSQVVGLQDTGFSSSGVAVRSCASWLRSPDACLAKALKRTASHWTQAWNLLLQVHPWPRCANVWLQAQLGQQQQIQQFAVYCCHVSKYPQG